MLVLFGEYLTVSKHTLRSRYLFLTPTVPAIVAAILNSRFLYVSFTLWIIAVIAWAMQELIWETSWARKSLLPGLGFSDVWHIFSFLSHWPIHGYLILWYTPWWSWAITAILGEIIWKVTKNRDNKDWDMWWVQTYKWLRSSAT